MSQKPDVRARLGTNGVVQYSNSQEEHQGERSRQEVFWRSLGKKIRKGAR